MDLHKTSITGILLRDDLNEEQQPYASFKTAYFLIYLSSFMTDFPETSLTWILLMRQSKWGATTLISWMILIDFHKPSLTGIPLIRQHNERQQPYANFKTAHLVKYIDSFLMDFHKTSITGILLMRWLKWGATTLISWLHFDIFLQAIIERVKYLSFMLIDFFWWDDITEGQKPYANFKTAYFVIYLSSFMTDFHETSLTWMLWMRQSKQRATTLISWLILMDFHKPSLTGILLIRQHNERQQTYANCKNCMIC